MPTPIVLTLPADDVQLQSDVIAELSPYARIRAEPSTVVSPTFGLNEVKLIIELISDSTAIIANAAAIATFIMVLKDWRKQKQESGIIKIARLGEPELRLEEVDEATVQRIIGLDELKQEER